MEQPQDYVVKDKENMLYRLNKALGLKQAPQTWNNKIESYFTNNEFHRNPNESPLYVKKGGTNEFLIVCLYVDDLIYTDTTNLVMLEKFKKVMMKEYKMTGFGLRKYFLGIQVPQKKGEIFISQEKHTKDFLKKFNISMFNPVTTPMIWNERSKKGQRNSLHRFSGFINVSQ